MCNLWQISSEGKLNNIIQNGKQMSYILEHFAFPVHISRAVS